MNHILVDESVPGNPFSSAPTPAKTPAKSREVSNTEEPGDSPEEPAEEWWLILYDSYNMSHERLKMNESVSNFSFHQSDLADFSIRPRNLIIMCRYFNQVCYMWNVSVVHVIEKKTVWCHSVTSVTLLLLLLLYSWTSSLSVKIKFRKTIWFECKVEYVFLMVTWSEFRMVQSRDDGHREDAPHFISCHRGHRWPRWSRRRGAVLLDLCRIQLEYGTINDFLIQIDFNPRPSCI